MSSGDNTRDTRKHPVVLNDEIRTDDPQPTREAVREWYHRTIEIPTGLVRVQLYGARYHQDDLAVLLGNLDSPKPKEPRECQCRHRRITANDGERVTDVSTTLCPVHGKLENRDE